MAEHHLRGRLIRVLRGDITDLDVDAFAYDARNDLVLGAGYGNAIAVRGGPAVQEALKKLTPVATGEAVVTTAGKLKATLIIHAVGPKFREEHEDEKLRAATLNLLARAEESGVMRLAVPPLGTGFYGMPVDACARTMVAAIDEHLRASSGLQEITICVRDTWEVAPFDSCLARLSRDRDGTATDVR